MKKCGLLCLLTLLVVFALGGCSQNKNESDIPATESGVSAESGESADINTENMPAGYKILDGNSCTLSDGTQLFTIMYDIESTYAELGMEIGDVTLLPSYTMLYTNSDFEALMVYDREFYEGEDWSSLDEEVQNTIIKDFNEIFLNYPVQDSLEAAYKAKTDDANPKTGSTLVMEFTSDEIKDDIITVHMSAVFNEGWDLEEYNKRMELTEKISGIYSDSDLSVEEQEEDSEKMYEEIDEIDGRRSANDQNLGSADYQYNVKTGERVE